jgi:large subunit ribosomal protein L24
MKFGAGPRLDGVLSARQLDLDRLAATGDATPGTPFSILASLKDSFAPNLRPSWPVKIGIGIDNVTLGGAMLQSLRGDLRSDKTGWSLDHIEFRAPGQTQVQLAGKVGGDMSFSGSVDMTSGDPRALLAWLDGRSDLPIAALRPVRLRGNVTLGAEAVTIEAMQAEIDRRAVEGSAGYRFASGGRKARVEAQLRAPDLNADELIEFARAMFVDRNLERPGEIALAVDFGGMALAGIDAKGVRARLKYDDQGLRVEQLAIADFGGVGLGGNGSIETGDTGPRGSLVLDVEARAWAGIDALAAKFAPQLADDVRLITQRLGAAKLHASLDVDKDAAPNGSALARMTLDGQVGALRVNFRAEGRGDPAAPGSARIRVDADASADDGAALLQAFGLDALLRGQAGPGEAKLQIAGPADGELNVSARLAVGDLHAESHGTARAGRDGGFRLASGLMVTKGDGRTLPLPFTLQSRLAVADGTATLSDVSAILPDSRMRGQLSIRLGRPLDVSGRFETDMLDAPSIVGTAIGLPPSSPDGAWSTDPFARTNLPDLNARLEFKAAQVVLGGGMRASDMSGVLRLSSSEIGLEDIHGQVAGGRLSGTASFRRSGDVVNTQLHFALKDADAAVLTGREGAPVSGRLDTQAEVEGYGLTPKALAGSLNGNGTVSLRQAGIGKLDPRAFAVAMRAVDQGMPLDAAKLRDVVGPALEAGRLGVKDLEGVINIVNGQARLGTVIAHGDGADLAVSGNLDLVTQALDARLVLTAADAVTTAGRPELTVTLKGPLSAPRRTTDVSTLTGWLALRAVEQQSKRLEQIEAERSGRMPPLSVSSSSASAAPAAGPGQKAAPLPPPINIKPAPKPAPAPRASGLSEHDRYLDPFNSQR